MSVSDVTNDQLLLAIKSFLTTYATPALTNAAHVIAGYQNDITFPSDGNDFCVATPILEEARGTPIQEWDDEDDIVTIKQYHDVQVQIDCYSSAMFDAKDRANTYAMVACSEYGVDAFKTYDIDCQYADGIQNLSGVGDSGKYTSRWAVTLHLGYWKVVTVTQDYFTTVTPTIKNVDVAFPPS